MDLQSPASLLAVSPTLTENQLIVSKPVHRKRQNSLTERATNCLTDQGLMTSACLQSLYNIPSTPATNLSNQIAVSGYENEWPLYSDLPARSIISFTRVSRVTVVIGISEAAATGYGPEYHIQHRLLRQRNGPSERYSNP